MSLDIVLPALAEIETEIEVTLNPTPGPGLTLTAFAFETAPNSVSGNLPCFVNLPTSSNLDEVQGGEDERGIDVVDIQNITATLYVAGAGTGTPGEKFGQCEAWIPAALAVFVSHPALKLAAGVIRLRYLGHNGIRGDLVYGGQQYYGISFRLQTSVRLRINWAAGE